MCKSDDIKQYFDVLEIGSDASFSEVENAYRMLKKLYSGNSIAIAPLEEELNEETRAGILEEIEYAYRQIIHFIQQGGTPSKPKRDEARNLASEDEIHEYLESIESYKGGILKKIREMRGLELRDMAVTTNIGCRYLNAIEEENFKELPARIYLKGFIVTYGGKLGLDGKKVAEDIIERFDSMNSPAES